MIKHKYLSGGLMALVGLGTIVGSNNYTIGSLARMGPGLFPLLLGVIMLAIGLLIAVTPDSPDEVLADSRQEPFSQVVRAHLRPWSAIIGGMVLFIVLGHYGGLVPATFALVLVSALGDHNNSIKSAFWLAVGVTVFAVVVFHYAMQMQFPLFTWG